MRLRIRLCAAAVVLAGLTGCSGSGGEEQNRSNEPVGGGDQGSAVEKGNAQAVDPSKAVVQATVNTAGGKAEVAILSLAARGKLAHLSVAITPHYSGTPSLFRLNGTGFAASLLDSVNLKRYVPVTDSSGARLQPNELGDLLNNQPNTLNWTFAAPPENVQAVDVQLGQWPIFRNVPIER